MNENCSQGRQNGFIHSINFRKENQTRTAAAGPDKSPVTSHRNEIRTLTNLQSGNTKPNGTDTLNCFTFK